ncbi:DUF378 domain-containing protein [Candidatus Woesearchaeota archaeon]|nr:DUF378 domain-containing protein [Candidatus Woesearchaeota archaeon]|tara:strand:+ start:981 stop:1172 length:192 start_codon:yes stop_codon:yes gene_type:complete
MARKGLALVTQILVLVGALNWGLVGLFDFNLITKILGTVPTVEKVVYVLVGLSALYEIYLATK